ncbi:MAG TPA: DNA polymerase III subunit delta [Burkholderiales bacterium]|nr:DNA polymerase III subunit delta [Burkholderiales bacterium]
MRTQTEQLPRELARGLKPLYVVYGEELLLALEAADRIRAAALERGHGERRVLVAEPGFDWRSLAMERDSLSLFAPKRLIDLRIPSGKPGKEGAEALQSLASALAEDTVVLITLPGLDRQAQSSRWFAALEAAGVAVHAAEVRRERLGQWLAGRLASQGHEADAQALDFLVERVQGNLMAAHQEVQKLALLFAPGPLSLAQVRDAVVDVARFDVFEIGPALLGGDRARLVRVLDGLRAEGTAPPLVLWAIAEEARAMAKVATAVAEGTPLAHALRDARVWGPRQDLMPAALRRLGRPQLVGALRRAARIDRMIKGLEDGDAWDALLQLGLALASPAPQGRGPVNKGKIDARIRG